MLAGQIGARGRIRTCTLDALDVVPLLIGLHEQTPPAGLDYRLGSRRAGPFELRALGGVKWFTEPKLGAKAGRHAG